jgi:hypothetical protein
MKENIHVTVEPDCEQFDGSAAAVPASASAEDADNPAAIMKTNVRQLGRGDPPTKTRLT